MRFTQCIAALAVSTTFLVSAAPSTDTLIKINSGLRLIKISEADPGSWLTSEEIDEKYVAKKVNFIDITEITDQEVLRILSTPPGAQQSKLLPRQSVTYPTAVSHVTEADALIAKATTTGPKSWLLTLTEYYNRHYQSTYGTQSATWLFNQVKTIASSNTAITVTQFTHSAFNQPSIIAKIPGTSTNLVIVGAHFDSTGGSSTARGPGADDDGSGVVTILEALRVLASSAYKPKNTLEFHFYAGEEGGLLGSSAIFKNYKSAGKTVLAMVAQDMTGYSPSGRVSVYTDYVSTPLTTYVKKIVQQYTGLAPTTDACGYGCSDHASAYSNGFPASYVCDEVIKTSSPYIHSSADAYSTIMWDAILRHTKFTIGFLVEASYL